MERLSVVSSNIEAVGYDQLTKVLEVKFKDLVRDGVTVRQGGIYHYKDVDADTHGNMMVSESVGKFLNKNVKGKFAVNKVEIKQPINE